MIMRRHLVMAFACLMLSSCAIIYEKISVEPVDWLDQQSQRKQIENWEIRGRLGVQTQTKGGSVDVIWKQSGQDYTIRLILPLGVGSYLIQGNERYADVRSPSGDKQRVDDVGMVFASALGKRLPVTAIKNWIRGIPSDVLPIDSVEWNRQGRLNNIEQSGWFVEMTNYSGNGLFFPHALYISRNDDSELDIRFIIRQWIVDN